MEDNNVLPKTCGQTNVKLGAKIMIVSKEDNSVTGTATHPFAFGCTDKSYIGVYLDKPFMDLYQDGKMNVHINDFIVTH